MKKLLHIIATPRGEESRTLKVTQAFLEALKEKSPGLEIDELNVTTEKLPDITAKNVSGKYVLLGGGDLSGELKDAWQEIVNHIERFLSADAYLVSTPMWNFSIPYQLKHYIDIIVQPKYLFKYTAKGPEGLVRNKKMAVVTSRGGDYSPGSPFHPYDLQVPYIKTIFGLTGLTDITFINAQPMDMFGPDETDKIIEKAKEEAVKLAEGFLS